MQAESIKVDDVQDVEFFHHRFCMCSWRGVVHESDNLLLNSDQGLDVKLLLIVRSPDSDGVDEVWVDVDEVELSHCGGWKQFVCVLEGLYQWLQLLDDGCNMLVVLEIVLDDHSQKFCLFRVFDRLFINTDVDLLCDSRFKENRKVSLCGIGDQIIGVKVGDQLCEFFLGFLLEGVYAMCGDDEGSVVSVGVDCGLYCFYDIVNVQEEKCG